MEGDKITWGIFLDMRNGEEIEKSTRMGTKTSNVETFTAPSTPGVGMPPLSPGELYVQNN